MRSSNSEPIGQTIRDHRVNVLKQGLRDTAQLLQIAAPHLTDIEKGRRTPSEALMIRIAEVYSLPLSKLRAGWSRAESVVNEMATSSETNAEKVPQFLRTAGNLTAEQWDVLIRQASQLSKGKKRKS